MVHDLLDQKSDDSTVSSVKILGAGILSDGSPSLTSREPNERFRTHT